MNYVDYSNIDLASISTGLRENAAFATATWIHGGFISKSDTKFVIDHNKVKELRETMKTLSLDFYGDFKTDEIEWCYMCFFTYEEVSKQKKLKSFLTI